MIISNHHIDGIEYVLRDRILFVAAVIEIFVVVVERVLVVVGRLEVVERGRDRVGGEVSSGTKMIEGL